MRDTFTEISSELDNKSPTDSTKRPYQSKDITNPSQAPTQSDGEGTG